MTGRILFIFLDGVGIGPSDPAVNPFVRARDRLPTFRRLAGGDVPALDGDGAVGSAGGTAADEVGPVGAVPAAFGLDASLGVHGLPQSGTGQAALLTGESAAEIHGGHFGPWTPVRLRPLVEERSVLRRARDAGASVAFANAYPEGWPGPRGERRVAGPPLAARGAGVLDRHVERLAAGEAVASEIVNDAWRTRLGHAGLPHVTPEEAGRNLAHLSAAHDLTLFAHYATDTAGHRGGLAGAEEALVRVDRFLSGVVGALDQDTTLLVASDHGNIEDVRFGHTHNPALGLASGPHATRLRVARDLREVAGLVLESLGVS